MLSLVSSVALVAVTAAGARTFGHVLVGSRWRFGHPALQLAAETAIGLLIVSHLVFAAALLGWATPLTFYALFGALGLLALANLRNVDWADLRQGIAKSMPKRAMARLLAGSCAVFGAWIILLARLPPIGFDSLVYHLDVPRQILRQGGHAFFPDNIYAYFPQLGEMLFLYGLGIAGDAAARLFHLLFGLLLCLAIFGFSRKHLSRRWSFLAAMLFVTVPSVVQTLPFAYVDLPFALYVFLALVSVLEYFHNRSLGWLFAAGIMAGGAWATKYTGMQVVFLLMLILLAEHLFSRRKELPVAVIIVPAVAFLIFFPYLVRTWVVTGWPFFPFELGGLSLTPDMNWDAERSGLYMDYLSFYGATGETYSIVDRLLAPLLVFVNARFWVFEAYDGIIGPVFLLIPLLLFRASKPRDVKLIILFSLGYLYYWASTTLQVRFLFPVLPMLAFLLAFGLSQLSELRAKLLTGVVIALMLVSLGLGVRENLTARPWNSTERPWSFLAGNETREEFWRRRIQIYPIYEEANRLLGPDDLVYMVDMRHIGYLLECRWRADFIFQRWNLIRLLDSSSTAAELAGKLRDQGITHLMIDELLTLAPEALDTDQRRLLMEFLNTQAELLASNAGGWPASLWKIIGP